MVQLEIKNDNYFGLGTTMRMMNAQERRIHHPHLLTTKRILCCLVSIYFLCPLIPNGILQRDLFLGHHLSKIDEAITHPA
jgi:hypothetical protein